MSAPIALGRSVSVRVPATTANLGPGFDTLGMALTIEDTLQATVREGSGVHVSVHGVGEGEVPTDETNLIARSMAHAFASKNIDMPGIDLIATNVIPHGRGLGSSGAAIVSGVMAAKGLLEGIVEFTPEELLALATDMEGHQPETVPHQDAIFNLSRSALLIAALIQSPELLFEATEDRLHQDYRASAMKDTDALLQSLRSAGFAAVVSGAGPSVLILCSDPAQRLEVQKVVDAHQGGVWSSHMLTVDERGATVEELPALAD